MGARTSTTIGRAARRWAERAGPAASRLGWLRGAAIVLVLGLVLLPLVPLLDSSSAAGGLPAGPASGVGADGDSRLVLPQAPAVPGAVPQGAGGPLSSVTAPDQLLPAPPAQAGGVGATFEAAGAAVALTPGPPAAAVPAAGGAAAGAAGIPGIVLAAYQQAAGTLAGSVPGCRMTWQIIAGIGKIESDHASGGRVNAEGTAAPAILGPLLDGSGATQAIHDTDGGRLDGSTLWDRAVGPMQFIPSTWVTWASTLRASAVPDPQNVFDAALAAGRYLCAAGGDLGTSQGLDKAILSYNHSETYRVAVLGWITYYTSAQATAQPGPASTSPAPAPVSPVPAISSPPTATAPTTAAPQPASSSPPTATAPTTAAPPTATPEPQSAAPSLDPAPAPDPSAGGVPSPTAPDPTAPDPTAASPDASP